MVALASETDSAILEADWPYGNVTILKGLTPSQAMALYLEVVAKPPQWETARDLAMLDTMLFRQRLKGSHGQAHGNSRTMKAKAKEPKPPQRCPLCGSSNLGRPVYRDAAGIRLFSGTALWFPPSAEFAPPGPDPGLGGKSLR